MVLSAGLAAPAAEPEADLDMEALEAEFAGAETASDLENPKSPLTMYNRAMFKFNDKLLRWVFKPVAKGYNWVMPRPGRQAVQRFFSNLGYPVRGVNNLLQGKFRQAGVETARFGINSTIGLAGFFDPAKSKFDLEPSNEDFGQTLGCYGIGAGPYIVLPVLGPSNLRDTLGFAADVAADPAPKVAKHNDYGREWRIGRGFGRLNSTSLFVEEYEALYDKALDPYVFFRDAYTQRRAAQIKE